jgi:phosphoribosylglycinamide formyltransferase 1
VTGSRARIAVLASGGGSNLQAILDHFDALGRARAGDVVLVAGERAEAGAQARARARGIPAALLPTTEHADRRCLASLLADYRIDLVVLAGYLRLVPTEVVRAFHERIVNVHPGLLPAFGGQGMYGHRVHEAVLRAGVAVTGVTVHLVDDEYDHGRVLAQWPVPVLAGDDAETLAARVLRVEHALYPRAVQALAAGETIPRDGGPHGAEPYFLLQPDAAGFVASMNRALGHTDHD